MVPKWALSTAAMRQADMDWIKPRMASFDVDHILCRCEHSWWIWDIQVQKRLAWNKWAAESFSYAFSCGWWHAPIDQTDCSMHIAGIISTRWPTQHYTNMQWWRIFMALISAHFGFPSTTYITRILFLCGASAPSSNITMNETDMNATLVLSHFFHGYLVNRSIYEIVSRYLFVWISWWWCLADYNWHAVRIKSN